MKIRVNKDGKRNLQDLRRAVAALDRYYYLQQSCGWVIGVYGKDGFIRMSPAPYWMTERDVCEEVLERHQEAIDAELYGEYLEEIGQKMLAEASK